MRGAKGQWGVGPRRVAGGAAAVPARARRPGTPPPGLPPFCPALWKKGRLLAGARPGPSAQGQRPPCAQKAAPLAFRWDAASRAAALSVRGDPLVTRAAATPGPARPEPARRRHGWPCMVSSSAHVRTHTGPPPPARLPYATRLRTGTPAPGTRPCAAETRHRCAGCSPPNTGTAPAPQAQLSPVPTSGAPPAPRAAVGRVSALPVVAKQNAQQRERLAEQQRSYNRARRSAVATRMKKVRGAGEERGGEGQFAAPAREGDEEKLLSLDPPLPPTFSHPSTPRRLSLSLFLSRSSRPSSPSARPPPRPTWRPWRP